MQSAFFRRYSSRRSLHAAFLRHCADGFECDEGVKRNQGRPGAVQAPDVLRKALANMASHQGHERLADMGSIMSKAMSWKRHSGR
jgi:arginase family enzyme